MEDKTCIKNGYVFNIDGRTVGHIEKDTYVTTRTPKHFMKKFSGFGVSSSILKLLVDNNIRYILIRYDGALGTIEYFATVMKFINSEKEFTFVSNNNMDKQKFLSVGDMAEL